MNASKQGPVNGKYYPLWSQFVDRKHEWIGGMLVEEGTLGISQMKTEIVDIKLVGNDDGTTWFEIVGKDFSCGTDVMYLSIPGDQDDVEWLEFCIRGAGDRFKIKRPGGK